MVLTKVANPSQITLSYSLLRIERTFKSLKNNNKKGIDKRRQPPLFQALGEAFSLPDAVRRLGSPIDPPRKTMPPFRHPLLAAGPVLAEQLALPVETQLRPLVEVPAALAGPVPQ